MIKRLAAILAALAMTLMVAAPALASTSLHQTTPISSDDATFQGTTTECADANLQPGQVLWHFVLTQTSADNGTLTAVFQNAGTVTVPASKAPDSTLQFDVITNGPDTLLSASTDATGDQLNLSHICQGGPPPVIPEAPASALLVLTAGLAGLGFVAWRMRQGRSVA